MVAGGPSISLDRLDHINGGWVGSASHGTEGPPDPAAKRDVSSDPGGRGR